MEYETERYTTFCRRIQQFVNHEITAIYGEEHRLIATCTGIDEQCFDCLLVRLNEIKINDINRQVPGIKYYQKVE